MTIDELRAADKILTEVVTTIGNAIFDLEQNAPRTGTLDDRDEIWFDNRRSLHRGYVLACQSRLDLVRDFAAQSTGLRELQASRDENDSDANQPPAMSRPSSTGANDR